MPIYRKIYEHYFGAIPEDENGRTFDIHHIDGNHNNNDISNLKCVSIREHFEIHLSQGDYGACCLIAKRMSMPPSEISRLAKEAGQKLIREGKHNWQGDGSLQRRLANKRVLNGTHHFMGNTNPSIKRVKERTHHWFNTTTQKENQLKKVKAGTHHLLSGTVQKKNWCTGTHRIRMEQGNHHTIIEHTCPYCKKTGKGPMMMRWHFDNCKLRDKNI